MGWWDDLGIPDAPHNMTGGPVAQTFLPGEPSPGSVWGNAPQQAAPMAGQFANNNQGFLDWATKTYGADPTRGGGFVNAQAGGGLQAMLQAYTQATGNTGNFLGGPSGDRVDFGQGVQDALTSGGQVWNAAGGSGAATTSQGAGGYMGGQVGQGGSPGANGLTAPATFSYQPSSLGNFQGPAPYQAPAPFQSPSGVPAMQTLNYSSLGEPTKQNPIQVSDPQQLQYQEYTGNPGDSSYDFRFQQGQKATENALAHSGALRTGNAVKALTDYGQGMASTEYAAEDARRRTNTAMNNANAFQFGQANIGNQFNATQANNANNLAFGNQNFNQGFATNQANNQGEFQVGQANNQNALQQQAQQYGQAANTYGLNTSTQQGAQNQAFNQAATGYGLNLGAQNQGFNQALGAYQANANTGLAYGAQNQNNALGWGNLNLGYQNSNNAYSLGMGNLGLAQQGQQFNQGFATNQQNYQQQVMDPWQMNYQLASLGNPGQPNGQGYANAVGDLYTQQGNANAAGQVGGANAWSGALGNLGLSAQQLAYLQSLGGGRQPQAAG